MFAVYIEYIRINKAGSSKMFGEVQIVKYGKTKKSRNVPILRSLPHLTV